MSVGSRAQQTPRSNLFVSTNADADRVKAESDEPDTEAAWKERRELLNDIRVMAGGLVDLATAAAARFPPRELAAPEEEMPASEAEAEPEPREVATDESARAMPAVGSQDGENDEPRKEVA